MTKKTRIILFCAVAILILMCLFPPQSVEYHGTILPVDYEKHGYFFIGTDWSNLPLTLRPKIEYGKLALQSVLVCLFSIALLLVLGRKKSNEASGSRTTDSQSL